jgi:transposase
MKVHDYATRTEIIRRHGLNESAILISRELGVSYSSVRQLINRYREHGPAGLNPNYSTCGRSPTYSSQMIDRAIAMKAKHVDWAAPYILLQLAKEFAGQALPGARRLQQVFKACELQPHRTRHKRSAHKWATAPLECVQVDAKERLVTAQGQPCCYLNFVDEYTGSELDAFVFPLRPNQRGSSCRRVTDLLICHVPMGPHTPVSFRQRPTLWNAYFG